MDRRLIHYSRKPLTTIYSVKQSQPNRGVFAVGKPAGLWVSAEGEADWEEWCRSEKFFLPNLRCRTEIVLKPDHTVLKIVGEEALDKFHAEYSVVGYEYGNGLGVHLAIDWAKVATKYDGIIIAPYVYSRRLAWGLHIGKGSVSDWYYGWDCASGCIWNADAIAEYHPIKKVRKRKGEKK